MSHEDAANGDTLEDVVAGEPAPESTPTDVADGADEPDVPVDGPAPDLASEREGDGDGGDASGDGDAWDGPGLPPPYPPRPCDLSRPFDPPTPVRDLQSRPGTQDQTPRLSYDELTLYFSSSREGTKVIYSATRRLRTDPFSMPTLIPNLVGNDIDQTPTVTADGLTMYFESDRTHRFALLQSTRRDTSSAWSLPTPVNSISAPDAVIDDGGPSISPDGKVMYFHSSRSGSLEIFRTELSGGQFGPAFRVQGISTPYQEARPVVSEDELTLFFASSRPDGGAKGDYDIWMAKRKSKDVPFEAPVNLSDLNSSGFDSPGWLSADQCDFYFDNSGDPEGLRTYVAHRPLKPDADGGRD